jgi:hypothetical protein
MSIKCKNGEPHTHETVDEVRACYNVDQPTVKTSEDDANFYVINHPQEFGRDDIRRAEQALRRPPAFTAPATDKQRNFIKTLRRERGLDALDFTGSKAQASAEIKRLLDLPKDERLPQHKSGDFYPTIMAGHYAVPSLTGRNDYDFFRVDRPKGKWAGRIFVHRVIGGRPSVRVREMQAQEALKAIEKYGPTDAAVLYGKKLDRCTRCNRHLTDQASREHVPPMGPDCRGKAGY